MRYKNGKPVLSSTNGSNIGLSNLLRSQEPFVYCWRKPKELKRYIRVTNRKNTKNTI